MSAFAIQQYWSDPKQLAALERIADAANRSRAYGNKGNASYEQCLMIVLTGIELGIPPATALDSMHLIEGKIELSANLMANLIKRSGKYDYDVLKSTAECCEIRFREGERVLGTNKFDRERAERAQLWSKSMFQKWPQEMLFARCLSGGAKIYCPDALGGTFYVEGEISGALDEPLAISHASSEHDWVDDLHPDVAKRRATLLGRYSKLPGDRRRWFDTRLRERDFRVPLDLHREWTKIEFDAVNAIAEEMLSIDFDKPGDELDREFKAVTGATYDSEPAEYDDLPFDEQPDDVPPAGPAYVPVSRVKAVKGRVTGVILRAWRGECGISEADYDAHRVSAEQLADLESRIAAQSQTKPASGTLFNDGAQALAAVDG